MQSPSNSQLKAIRHESGPMLVMAGPGSGKSFVIIQRLLYLINERHIEPSSILVISFSKASAEELRFRFTKELRKQSNNINSESDNRYSKPLSEAELKKCDSIYISTFHACFFHILRETYHYSTANIITNREKYNMMKIILQDPAYEEEDTGDRAGELLSKISFYKNQGQEELAKTEEHFQRIYHAYNEEMHRNRKLDFEDMGLLCLQLFKSQPAVLKQWQKRFRYLLIDEFQDINPIQFAVVQMLCEEHKNLFVVGDDDQAIYSFRGASPKIMLGFESLYPGAEKVLLETNFRCSGNIVKKSLGVIAHNKVRFVKKIKAHKEAGEKVIFQGFPNRVKEYEYLIERIRELTKAGVPYTDIACIYRINQDMQPLAESLSRHKIPFVMKEQTNSIFHHFIAMDILSFLDFFLEGHKRGDFIRIMNKPLRYLSRNACTKEVITWEELKAYYQSKPYMVKNIEELEHHEKWIKRLDLFGAVHYIRKVMGYETYLKEKVKEENLLWEEALEILEFIQNSTRGMTSLSAWKEEIVEYEETLKQSKEEKEGVHLLTMHASKGLEFPYVFLPECIEGKTPYKKAKTPEAIEEERRMFYVAMTRAQTRLEILYPEDKKGKKGMQASSFLKGLI